MYLLYMITTIYALILSASYRRSNSERISDQKYDVENPEPEQGDINAHHQKLSGVVY